MSDHAEKLRTKIKESECVSNGEETKRQPSPEISECLKMLDIITDCQQDVNFLQLNMPSDLRDFTSSAAWDIHLLKTECATFLCSIPGELTCYQCHENFKNVHKKIAHIIKKHSSRDREPYSCEFCNQVRVFVKYFIHRRSFPILVFLKVLTYQMPYI